MQHHLIGKIAATLGIVALLYGLLMVVNILPNGWIFGITTDGALDGAIGLFLLGITFFLWPSGNAHGA